MEHNIRAEFKKIFSKMSDEELVNIMKESTTMNFIDLKDMS
jgi:hypothetical protein